MKDLSSIVGLQVIATDEGKQLGSVSQALVDLAAGKLVAVALGKKAILAEHIEVIGPDALMVSSSDKVKSRAALKKQIAGASEVLENPPQVVTDKGTSLGRLASVHLDPATKDILRYEVTGGALRDAIEGVVSLPVLEGTVHGEDTVVVPHEAARQHLLQTRGGLRGQLARIRGVFQTRYQQAGERTQELRQQGAERLKAGAEKARETAGRLTREAREELQEVVDKATQGDVDEPAEQETDEPTQHDTGEQEPE